MKLAILGSDGFLGKTLTEKFQSKYDVIPINRKNLNLTNYNEVNNWLKNIRPDTIINCATNGVLTATQTYDVNYFDIQNNLSIFLNFYNSKYTKKFINVGTGSEFDITKDLNSIEEHHILNVLPQDSYSYSKNLISRMILNRENFYTLRLFGCFGKHENNKRLFKKLLNNSEISLIDKKFDYISLDDYSKIINFYILNKDLIKDINCVYKEKYLLSDVVNLFVSIHKLEIKIQIEKITDKNYTGDFKKLQSLNIELEYLENGLKNYFF